MQTSKTHLKLFVPRFSFGKAVSMLVLAGASLIAASTAQAQVPAAVGTSPVNLTPKVSVNNGQAVVDACGNTYVMQVSGQNEGLVQIAAGSLAQTTLEPGASYYNQGTGLAIDSTKTFLYYPVNNSTTNQWYSSTWSVSTLSGCAITSTTTFPANGVSFLFSYYFGTASALAVDSFGSVYFVPSAPSNGNIGIVACDTLPTACTAPPTGKVASVALSNWQGDGSSSTINSLAVDSSGNIFFTDAAAARVYELAAGYKGAPVSVGLFKKPVGVSLDSQGNLYVADASASVIYEVPLEANGLNFADTFQVAANVTVSNQVGLDQKQNVYIAANPNVTELLRNAAQLPSANVAAAATAPINYVFNASTTVAAVNVQTGTAASTVFTGAGCSAKTYTVGQTCTETVSFTPTTAGLATGSVILAGATGNAISTSAVAGTGLAATITIDPGTLSTLTGTFKTPQGDFVDAQGSLYVVDAGVNTVTKFAAGASTGTLLTTGTITLKAPSAVAVDATGNIYISDTGNNRVVEIPVVNGALAPTSATALSISAASLALSAPAGLAVDAFGNLYIADAGNNRIVFVPNLSGTLAVASAAAYGVGLSKPLGVAVDISGNVFVADTGNNDVIEITAPVASNTHTKIITGLGAPSAIATDASGSIYVVSPGTSSVLKYPVISGGIGSPTYVGSTVAAPYGVALDNAGNLYVTDNVNALVAKVNRVQGTLPLGVTNVGQTSLPQSASISNAGTAALTFSTPDYTVSGNTSAGFAITSDSCTGSSVVAGNSCAITATLKPPTTELNATETLTLASNASNGTPSVQLIGSGANLNPSTVSVKLTSPASGSVTAGTPATFVATIGTGSSTIVPGGSVTFYNNGSQYGSRVNVTNVGGVYQAQITFANGLPAGTDTIQAQYSGDTINYTASQGTLQLTVIGVTGTLSLTAVTPYTSPQSVQDNAATPITLTAIFAAPSQIIPTGSVKFYYGSASNPTLIGLGSITQVNGVFQSQIVTSNLHSTATTGTAGENGSIVTNYNVFALYSGDNTYNPATSNTVPLVVVGAPAKQDPCATAPTLALSKTALAGGIATYTYSAASAPVVGQIVTVLSTTNGAGVLNVVGGTIASVTGTTTGTFTIAGFNSSLTVAAAADSGTAAALCAPNGTGATFTITPANPTVTVSSSKLPGQGSGSVTLNINSIGGWQGVLNFSCSGLPVYTTCSPYPGAPVVNFSTPASPLGPTQVQFNINTNVPPVTPNASSFIWWIAGLFGLVLLFARRRLGKHRLALTSAILLLLAGTLFAASGCGSGNFTNPDLTPVGNSTIKVTVTAAQGVPGTTNQYARDAQSGSFSIALTVQ